MQIQLRGLAELERKLDGKFLVQPEVEDALDTVAKRGQRGGKGLGAKMNPITVSRSTLQRRLISPVVGRPGIVRRKSGRKGTPRPGWMKKAGYNPRRSGVAWTRKNIGASGYGQGALGATARNALAKAARKIQARFAA